MASCGPPTHRVATTPAVAAGTRAAATPGVLPVQERNAAASPRLQGVSSAHPQSYEGFDPTFTQGKALYYVMRPRRFAINAPYERGCFWRMTTEAHTNKS